MLKLVDIKCDKAFYLHGAKFSGYIRSEKLTLEDIRICIERKAKVFEIGKNGALTPLSFANYKEDHGGIVNESVDNDWKHTSDPKVEVIGNKKFNHVPKDIIKEEDKPSTTSKSSSISTTVEFKDTVKPKDKIAIK